MGSFHTGEGIVGKGGGFDWSDRGGLIDQTGGFGQTDNSEAGQGWTEAGVGQKGRAAVIQQGRDRLEALSSHNKEGEWSGEKNG